MQCSNKIHRWITEYWWITHTCLYKYTEYWWNRVHMMQDVIIANHSCPADLLMYIATHLLCDARLSDPWLINSGATSLSIIFFIRSTFAKAIFQSSITKVVFFVVRVRIWLNIDFLPKNVQSHCKESPDMKKKKR